ncbi:hypothetical protein CHS0354_000794 [Potamilus streckersoni]|uniref:Uncharacterized protein n=1 Tax=Potamilus streckersoni TaxID=2493646 RepID=A0AAE0T8A6_9BIVA|nr:hypothetical protein CHS0354_000794 [Potamilus streckersoni]
MENKIIELWKPISISNNWEKTDTSILDDLAPSWFRKRSELKEGNNDYEEFINRLKRQHAIETGVVEKLYDLSDGITETFIREGFVESYLSHDDTNIAPQQLMVKRDEKVKYIDALEKADFNEPQELVSLFCNIQKRNIENALNYKSEKTETTFADVAKLFTEKIDILNSVTREQRQIQLNTNRKLIFDNIYKLLGNIRTELFKVISYEKAQIRIESVRPEDKKYYWHTQQIAEYAKLHNYYFNRFLPRGWFKISFVVSTTKRYDLVISVHHYSYDDSVIAIGSFLEFLEELPDNGEERTTIPINLKPFTVSLEVDSSKQFTNMDHYIHDIVKIALTIIANEIV